MVTHRHHIVPRHAGGTDDESNLVDLTIQEHAEAHRVLWMKFGRKEDWLAWKGLSGQIGREEILSTIYRENGKRLGAARAEQLRGQPAYNRGVAMSEQQKQKLRKPKTEEHKAALRKPKSRTARMGRYERTDEIRAKVAAKLTGRTRTAESRAKMSLARTGASNSRYKPLTIRVVHPTHGMFEGDRMDLITKHPTLTLVGLRNLTKGVISSHQGWVLDLSAAVGPHP